jgi:hypothetical protein
MQENGHPSSFSLPVVLCIAGSLRKALTVAGGYGIYIFLGQLYDYVL